MAAEVQPLPLERAPPGPAPLTPDQVWWKTFKNQVLLPSPHNTAITSITTPDVNPWGAQADTFAVTSGARVQIFNVKTRKLIKTVSRFGLDDVARSGALRRDGRVLLAGGDSGVIQAFDTGSRAILRQWKGEHGPKLPVHAVRWNPSVLTDLMSCSDDRTVRVWELTEEQAKWTGAGHEDYVRCGSYLPGLEGTIVSGSYDQTVRLWDTRQPRSVMTFKHSAPIEAVLPVNSATLAAAAGNEVSILNLVAGKPEHVIRAHQKTVTALSTAQKGTRLITGGLDGHVKIHHTESWEVITGFKYPAPVLALAVVKSGSEDRHLTVGLQTGLLSIRTRLAGSEKVKAREKEKRMQALIAGEADEYERKQKKKDMRQGIRMRDRGKDYRGEGADLIITGNDRPRRKGLSPWQESLRQSRPAQALDLALQSDASSQEVVTLLNALTRREATRAALEDRSAEQLLPILRWSLKHIAHPRHVYLVYDVLMLLLDLYGQKLADWSEEDGGEAGGEVVGLVKRLERRVRAAVDLAEKATNTVGMLEMLEAG